MSEQIVLRGVVLKETEVGDGNKMLTIFSKNYGKVTVKANGAKKSNSKFLAGTQQFTYCDYVVTKTKNIYVLNSAEIIKSFYKITEDYETLCCALTCVEIITKNIQDNFEANEELFLLIYTFQQMATLKHPKIILSMFIMKFMQILGLEPYLESCSICGFKEFESYFFGFEGLICDECKVGEDVIKINKNIIDAMNSVFNTSANLMYKDLTFIRTKGELKAFYNISVWYLRQHTDLEYKTLDSIN